MKTSYDANKCKDRKNCPNLDLWGWMSRERLGEFEGFWFCFVGFWTDFRVGLTCVDVAALL